MRTDAIEDWQGAEAGAPARVARDGSWSWAMPTGASIGAQFPWAIERARVGARTGAPARCLPAEPRNMSRHMLERATDEELVTFTREGSQEAFAVLDARYRRVLLGYCQRRLGDRDSAEDAVQQVFFAAYRSLMATERPIQLAPWLFTIARNQCITTARRHREHPLDEIEATCDDLVEQLEPRLALEQLVHDLRELPEDQRRALALTAFGLSSVEIAPLLGVRPGKIRALVFQAREALAATNEAREIACTTIRSELAADRRGTVRRTHLRRHLRECEDCQAYADQRRRARKPARARVAPAAALAA